jgi:hypothetical protein
MKRIITLALLIVGGIYFGCAKAGTPTSDDTPTEAYKRLFAAVKAKDTEAIKDQLTKKTNDFAKSAAQRFNKTLEQQLENGFTATTYSETLPEIRDERIKGNMGSVEVWNSRESKWEDLPFILEDGKWRLAVGDVFAGTFVSPGKGRDRLEKEAANAMGKGSVAPISNGNVMPDTRLLGTPQRSPNAK